MKKKYNLGSFCLSKRCLKILLCMKIIFLCTFVFCLQASAKVYSQDTELSLNLQKVSITKALKVISKKSDYHFLYNNDLLPDDVKVSINAVNKPMSFLLQDLFSQAGLSWQVLENNLIAIGYTRADILDLSGKVTDTAGNALVGVTLQVKGTTTGTLTDENGSFKLQAPDSATLVVSYVGYQTKEIKLKGANYLTITLLPSSAGLDEVVVVGYGTQKKSDLTGSVSSVNMDKAEAIPTTNVAEMLRGRAPGLEVTQDRKSVV